MTMRMGWMIGIGAVLLVVGAGVWWLRFDTYHLATVKEGVLYRDGVRTERQFENAVRRVKPRTVVRLIDEREQKKEPFVSEEAYCRGHGVEVVNLPIRLGGWPSGEQVKAFVELVEQKERQPVLVHCAQGVRRTGMMVAAYERAALGFDAKKADAAMLTFGHSERTVKDVQKFIELYDPTTGAVPDAMPVGQE